MSGGAIQKALVVEDCGRVRRATASQLHDWGFSVEAAATVREARGLVAAAGGYDLVLVDRNLADADGLDLVRDLHARRDPGRQSILVLTTESTRESILESLAAGADEYLMKPCDPESLGNKLALLGFGEKIA